MGFVPEIIKKTLRGIREFFKFLFAESLQFFFFLNFDNWNICLISSNCMYSNLKFLVLRGMFC